MPAFTGALWCRIRFLHDHEGLQSAAGSAEIVMTTSLATSRLGTNCTGFVHITKHAMTRLDMHGPACGQH